MSAKEDYDSDAPEELTAEQGIQQDEELSKVQKENKARVVREAKERRRLWAQRITPKKPSATVESVPEAAKTGPNQESLGNQGMLPSNIVDLLAAREKQLFCSDSEDEKTKSKSAKKKKKQKRSGVDTVILKETPPPQCLENSLAFLNRRKMQVPRSSAVLNNSNQALRFLSSAGVLSKKVTSENVSI